MSKAKKTNTKKTHGFLVFLMVLTIILCLLVIALIWGVSKGYVVLPQNIMDSLAVNFEIKPESTEPSSQSPSSQAPPPKLTVENNGAALNEEAVAELEKLLAKNPFSISLYYQNLSNGTVIEFNSLKKYPAGSVVKAPYCRWLMTQNPDLEETILFAKKDIVEGAGEIQHSEEGTPFTIGQLIEAMIVKSDNTAYNMLIKRFGLDGYVAYAKSLGVAANQNKQNIFGNLSPAGAAILFKDIYSYEISDPEQSALLLGYMKDTDYYGLIPMALDGTPVAHKYGYNGGNNGFHDAAIVYSDPPYVLTVFTSLDYEKSGTEEYIRTVVKAVNKLHQ